MFAALDDEEAYLLYYSLAFIYALPYVANGFELDGFALLSLLICTLHIQLERIAQTEPVEVELPSVLRRLVGGIPKAVRSLGRYSSRLGTELGGRTRSAEEARKRRPDRCGAVAAMGHNVCKGLWSVYSVCCLSFSRLGIACYKAWYCLVPLARAASSSSPADCWSIAASAVLAVAACRCVMLLPGAV